MAGRPVPTCDADVFKPGEEYLHCNRDALSEEFLRTLEVMLKQHHDKLHRMFSTSTAQCAPGPGGPRKPALNRSPSRGFRGTYNARASLANLRETQSGWPWQGRGGHESQSLGSQFGSLQLGSTPLGSKFGSYFSQSSTALPSISSFDNTWAADSPRGGESSPRGRAASPRRGARPETPHSDSARRKVAGFSKVRLGNVDTSDVRDVNERQSNLRVSECSTFSQYENYHRSQSLEVTLSQMRPSKTSYEGVLRHFIKKNVGSTTFEVLVSLLIVTNVLFCGFEVDYLARARLVTTPPAFYWAAVFYAVAFTIEIILRLVADGRHFFKKPQRGWNLFDVVVVVLSILEVCTFLEVSSGGQLPSFRMIRLVRVVRVLRIARIMRHFRSLRILIYSVLNTLRSLLWTMLLLCIILYMFGIVFTQATMAHVLDSDNVSIPGLEEYYGTVPVAAYTLFKAISGGHSWDEVAKPLLSLDPVWLVLYLLYFAFTYFAVLNVVTGVFCQTAIESANTDAEMAAQAQLHAKEEYIHRLETLFMKINTTQSGKITLRDFENSMQDERLRAYFESIDLSIDEAFSLFKLLDRDGEHVLDIDTFVTGCLKLRGSAKSIDIAMMMYENRWCMQRCLNSVKGIEHMMQIQAAEFVAHNCSGGTDIVPDLQQAEI